MSWPFKVPRYELSVLFVLALSACVSLYTSLQAIFTWCGAYAFFERLIAQSFPFQMSHLFTFCLHQLRLLFLPLASRVCIFDARARTCTSAQVHVLSSQRFIRCTLSNHQFHSMAPGIGLLALVCLNFRCTGELIDLEVLLCLFIWGTLV